MSEEVPESNALAAKAEAIIFRAVRDAAAAGAVPVSGSDISALTQVQAEMAAALAARHGIPAPLPLARTIVQAAGNGGAAQSFLSAAKSLPGLGLLLGQIAQPAWSAALTHALGHLLEEHFAQGGTLADFSVAEDAVRGRIMRYLRDAGRDRKDA